MQEADALSASDTRKSVVETISQLVSRDSMTPMEPDSQLMARFNGLPVPLPEKEAVEVRKAALNQLYKLDTMNRLDSSYTLSVLQVLRRLSKEQSFWQGMNFKLFFDIFYQVVKWASHGLAKDHAHSRATQPEAGLKREVLLVCLSMLSLPQVSFPPASAASLEQDLSKNWVRKFTWH